jgi:hypothetical protein
MGWIADFVRNLVRGEMPLSRRARLVVRNYARRFSTRQPCCGHPGEPGC